MLGILIVIYILVNSSIVRESIRELREKLIMLPLSTSSFSFHPLHFVSSSVSSRKEGGKSGEEGEEREGENKSPPVWLSPALSRLSNRGLRSSLLFNLSTE